MIEAKRQTYDVSCLVAEQNMTVFQFVQEQIPGQHHIILAIGNNLADFSLFEPAQCLKSVCCLGCPKGMFNETVKTQTVTESTVNRFETERVRLAAEYQAAVAGIEALTGLNPATP